MVSIETAFIKLPKKFHWKKSAVAHVNVDGIVFLRKSSTIFGKVLTVEGNLGTAILQKFFFESEAEYEAVAETLLNETNISEVSEGHAYYIAGSTVKTYSK